MPKNPEDYIIMKGKVVSLSRSTLMVELENGTTITTSNSGNIIKNKIKIVIGDIVDVEISKYDITRGIIRYRHPKAR